MQLMARPVRKVAGGIEMMHLGNVCVLVVVARFGWNVFLHAVFQPDASVPFLLNQFLFIQACISCELQVDETSSLPSASNSAAAAAASCSPGGGGAAARGGSAAASSSASASSSSSASSLDFDLAEILLGRSVSVTEVEQLRAAFAQAAEVEAAASGGKWRGGEVWGGLCSGCGGRGSGIWRQVERGGGSM